MQILSPVSWQYMGEKISEIPAQGLTSRHAGHAALVENMLQILGKGEASKNGDAKKISSMSTTGISTVHEFNGFGCVRKWCIYHRKWQMFRENHEQPSDQPSEYGSTEPVTKAILCLTLDMTQWQWDHSSILNGTAAKLSLIAGFSPSQKIPYIYNINIYIYHRYLSAKIEIMIITPSLNKSIGLDQLAASSEYITICKHHPLNMAQKNQHRQFSWNCQVPACPPISVLAPSTKGRVLKACNHRKFG